MSRLSRVLWSGGPGVGEGVSYGPPRCLSVCLSGALKRVGVFWPPVEKTVFRGIRVGDPQTRPIDLIDGGFCAIFSLSTIDWVWSFSKWKIWQFHIPLAPSPIAGTNFNCFQQPCSQRSCSTISVYLFTLQYRKNPPPLCLLQRHSEYPFWETYSKKRSKKHSSILRNQR